MKLHRLPLVLLLAIGASCASTDLHGVYKKRLQSASAAVQKQEYRKAATQLEGLLAESATASGEHALQRFFAAYLLTRLHEEASLSGAFLEEPGASSAGFSLEEGGAVSRKSPSPVAHLVAATYHASFGRLWYEAARKAESGERAGAMLPAELAQLGTTQAMVHLHLSLLDVYARLHFQDKVEEILAGMGELCELARCEQALDDCAIAPAIRPWIYLALFDYLKTRDEPMAYKFGIRARESGQQSTASFEPALSERIATWILEESRYEFRSPANQLFDPGLEGCTVTGTPNIEFEAVLREQ